MTRINTTSIEFLATEAGNEFANTLVAQTLEQGEPESDIPDTPEAQVQKIISDFLEMLRQLDAPFDENVLRPALLELYLERYTDLLPTDKPELFFWQTKTVALFLATLTRNVWRLDTGRLPGMRGTRPKRDVLLYHLHWAREAFGWWRASVTRYEYDLRLPRPCKGPTELALDLALDPALKERIVAAPESPLEIENGCPIC